MKKLEEAWQLFDQGQYKQSEKLYLECFAHLDENDSNYRSNLMGLVYVESFLEKFDKARAYAAALCTSSVNEEERHVALHQAGMVERMAGEYQKALEFFSKEADILETFFSDDVMKKAVNLYELGYTYLKQERTDDANEKMKEALKYAKESKDEMTIACAYRGLGEISAADNSNESAKYYFENAIKHFLAADDKIAVQEVETMMNNIN